MYPVLVLWKMEVLPMHYMILAGTVAAETWEKLTLKSNSEDSATFVSLRFNL